MSRRSHKYKSSAAWLVGAVIGLVIAPPHAAHAEASRKQNIDQAVAAMVGFEPTHFRRSGAHARSFINDAQAFLGDSAAWSTEYERLSAASAPNPRPHHNDLSLAHSFPEAQPGDIVRIHLKSGLIFALVYFGEKSFIDVPHRKYSFFIYPWRSRLELNTFPPRWHRQLVEYEQAAGTAPKFALKFSLGAEQTLLLPGRSGAADHSDRRMWRWLKPPVAAHESASQRAKIAFDIPHNWHENPQVEVFRPKNCSELVYIRRPKDMLCWYQVNRECCTFAALASVDNYESLRHDSNKSREKLEYIYGYQRSLMQEYLLNPAYCSTGDLASMIAIAKQVLESRNQTASPNERIPAPDYLSSPDRYRAALSSSDMGTKLLGLDQSVDDDAFALPISAWITTPGSEFVLSDHFRLDARLLFEPQFPESLASGNSIEPGKVAGSSNYRAFHQFVVERLKHDHPLMLRAAAPSNRDVASDEDLAKVPISLLDPDPFEAPLRTLRGNWLDEQFQGGGGHMFVIVGIRTDPRSGRSFYYLQDPLYLSSRLWEGTRGQSETAHRIMSSVIRLNEAGHDVSPAFTYKVVDSALWAIVAAMAQSSYGQGANQTNREVANVWVHDN